eukprot:2641017-Amphidinium_carterae.1
MIGNDDDQSAPNKNIAASDNHYNVPRNERPQHAGSTTCLGANVRLLGTGYPASAASSATSSAKSSRFCSFYHPAENLLNFGSCLKTVTGSAYCYVTTTRIECYPFYFCLGLSNSTEPVLLLPALSSHRGNYTFGYLYLSFLGIRQGTANLGWYSQEGGINGGSHG